MAYLDYNATTPVHPAARDAWLEAVDRFWQNPSSPYRQSARVRNELEASRARIAGWLGCKPERIIFNSGATEGVNAVFAYVAGRKDLKASLGLFSPTEHPCTIESAGRHFCDRKRWLRIDEHGRVDLADLEKRLDRERPSIVSVMAANNETGVIQPWPEIAALCRTHRTIYHCDTSQWIAKMPADGLGECSFLTASAHKFGGPKGVGFLVIPEGCNDFRSLLGGEQESGFRAGTEDFPSIAAMVAAWEAFERKSRKEGEARSRFRRKFEEAVRAKVSGITIPGEGAKRLWNTTSLIMPAYENHRWVSRLDRKGFQISTGSACASGDDSPSHVLAAMGFSREETKRAVRISSGWSTTEEEWTGLAEAIAEVFEELNQGGDSSLTEVVSI